MSTYQNDTRLNRARLTRLMLRDPNRVVSLLLRYRRLMADIEARRPSSVHGQTVRLNPAVIAATFAELREIAVRAGIGIDAGTVSE